MGSIPMKQRNKTRLLLFCLIFTGLILTEAPVLYAQDAPFREFTNPDELVTLGRETSFSQSFTILGGFSRQFADKILIDRSEKSGASGFNIPSMHWRQALDYIANAHELVIRENPDYFEIVPAASIRTTPTTRTGTETSRPTATLPPALATLNTREIEISAIFFEGNRRKLREIGVDWTAMKDGVVRISNFAANSVSLDVAEIEMPPQTVGGGWEVGAFMRFLEATNIGEILSSPSVRVMEGKQGDIQIGQDFSIKQRDFAGNVTDAFYSTGTILTVVPHLIKEADTSFIFLEIRAERSTATPDPVSTIINKQEAQTQVLLFSGESTVIAGLYETDELIIRRGVPILKDLPGWFFGLRYLFGYNSKEFIQKELIVVIRAEIVPSLRERFDQQRNSAIEVLEEGRQRIQQYDHRN